MISHNLVAITKPILFYSLRLGEKVRIGGVICTFDFDSLCTLTHRGTKVKQMQTINKELCIVLDSVSLIQPILLNNWKWTLYYWTSL